MYEQGKSQADVGPGGLGHAELSGTHSHINMHGVSTIPSLNVPEITAPEETVSPKQEETPETAIREHHPVIDREQFGQIAKETANAAGHVAGTVFNDIFAQQYNRDWRGQEPFPSAEQVMYRVQGRGDDEPHTYVSIPNLQKQSEQLHLGPRGREIVDSVIKTVLEEHGIDVPEKELEQKQTKRRLFEADVPPEEPTGPVPDLLTREDFMDRAVRGTDVRAQFASLVYNKIMGVNVADDPRREYSQLGQFLGDRWEIRTDKLHIAAERFHVGPGTDKVVKAVVDSVNAQRARAAAEAEQQGNA